MARPDGRRRAAAAHGAAPAALAELDAATGEALRAERRTVARDLHDAVSGGIGVLVIQAGAAQALRRSDGFGVHARIRTVGAWLAAEGRGTAAG